MYAECEDHDSPAIWWGRGTGFRYCNSSKGNHKGCFHIYLFVLHINDLQFLCVQINTPWNSDAHTDTIFVVALHAFSLN